MTKLLFITMLMGFLGQTVYAICGSQFNAEQ